MPPISKSKTSTGTNHDRPRVAFLGPKATYSHQAAFNRFDTEVEYIAKDSIAETLSAIPSEASIAIIPAENSIFGTVVETLDLLRLPEVGTEKVIVGEIILEVQHCLLAAGGTKLEDIKHVLSHEQALGQCSNYLKEHLPDATLTKTPSTSAAAEAVLAQDARYCSAAICSEICVKVFPDLVVLEKGIQNEHNNFTKFWIIKDSSANVTPNLMPTKAHNALIRIIPLEQPTDLSVLIGRLGFPVLRIDRRPSTRSVAFHDVYFLHVASGTRNSEETVPWRDKAETALEDARARGCQASILGLW